MADLNHRYYTLDEAMATIRSMTPEITDAEFTFLPEWMYMGVRQLGTSKELLKQCFLEIDDLSVAKPRDYYMATDISLFDSKGNEVDFIFRPGKLRHHLELIPPPRFVEVYEDGDYFHLSSTADAMGVSKFNLEYYALPTDEDGVLLIPERYIFALVMFVKYMLAVRNNDPYNRIAIYKQNWEQEAARVRAKNMTPNMLEAKEGIFRTYMSMITKPTRDRF